jgi:hypothetical protein
MLPVAVNKVPFPCHVGLQFERGTWQFTIVPFPVPCYFGSLQKLCRISGVMLVLDFRLACDNLQISVSDAMLSLGSTWQLTKFRLRAMLVCNLKVARGSFQ